MENTKYLAVTHRTYGILSLSFACSVHHVLQPSPMGPEQLDISAALIPCSVSADHKALIQLCTSYCHRILIVHDIFIAISPLVTNAQYYVPSTGVLQLFVHSLCSHVRANCAAERASCETILI
jgi:hypothetical protein